MIVLAGIYLLGVSWRIHSLADFLCPSILLTFYIAILQVPLFSQMDDQLLDAICERLVSSLSTEGTYIVREGDLVTEMLFIIRGKLESSTTDGGRTGFFNSITLKPGDFCGEELLGWALVPKPTVNLPSSTRTVKAILEVEAFALRAEDLRFVASQFRRLHSRKLYTSTTLTTGGPGLRVLSSMLGAATRGGRWPRT